LVVFYDILLYRSLRPAILIDRQPTTRRLSHIEEMAGFSVNKVLGSIKKRPVFGGGENPPYRLSMRAKEWFGRLTARCRLARQAAPPENPPSTPRTRPLKLSQRAVWYDSSSAMPLNRKKASS
jgi:hypothetical protein